MELQPYAAAGAGWYGRQGDNWSRTNRRSVRIIPHYLQCPRTSAAQSEAKRRREDPYALQEEPAQQHRIQRPNQEVVKRMPKWGLSPMSKCDRDQMPQSLGQLEGIRARGR